MKNRYRTGIITAALAGCMLFAVGVETETLTTAEVFSAFQTVQPGEILPLAVRLAVADGWHTYAEKPGDSGMPPSFTVQGPEGLKQLPWKFPPPMTFTDSTGTTYGYENSVVLLGGVRIPASLPEGVSLELTVDLKWMICRDACLFFTDRKTLTVQSGAVSSDPSEEWIAVTREHEKTNLENKKEATAPGKETL